MDVAKPKAHLPIVCDISLFWKVEETRCMKYHFNSVMKYQENKGQAAQAISTHDQHFQNSSLP